MPEVSADEVQWEISASDIDRCSRVPRPNSVIEKMHMLVLSPQIKWMPSYATLTKPRLRSRPKLQNRVSKKSILTIFSVSYIYKKEAFVSFFWLQKETSWC